jgi:hypothetical protein
MCSGDMTATKVIETIARGIVLIPPLMRLRPMRRSLTARIGSVDLMMVIPRVIANPRPAVRDARRR